MAGTAQTPKTLPGREQISKSGGLFGQRSHPIGRRQAERLAQTGDRGLSEILVAPASARASFGRSFPFAFRDKMCTVNPTRGSGESSPKGAEFNQISPWASPSARSQPAGGWLLGSEPVAGRREVPSNRRKRSGVQSRWGAEPRKPRRRARSSLGPQ